MVAMAPRHCQVMPSFNVEGGQEDHQVGHDQSTLPHLHYEQPMRRLFPILGAPPLGANVNDGAGGRQRAGGAWRGVWIQEEYYSRGSRLRD